MQYVTLVEVIPTGSRSTGLKCHYGGTMKNDSPDVITISEDEYNAFREQLTLLEAKLDQAIEVLEAYGVTLD